MPVLTEEPYSWYKQDELKKIIVFIQAMKPPELVPASWDI